MPVGREGARWREWCLEAEPDRLHRGAPDEWSEQPGPAEPATRKFRGWPICDFA